MSNDTTESRCCLKCNVEYPLTAEYWHRNKNTKHGFQSRCKMCRREENRAWNQKNQERCAATMKAWRDTHREHERKYSLSDKSRQSSSRWNSANPQIMRVIKQRYRARKKSLPNNFTAHHWSLCLDYWHNACAVCGGQLRDLFGDVEPHADHWIALNTPGCPGTIPENMICLCNHCNKSKNDRLPTEWVVWKFGTRKSKGILERIRKYFDWIKSQ